MPETQNHTPVLLESALSLSTSEQTKEKKLDSDDNITSNSTV